MKLLRLRLEPRSAFGSALAGDTLFGQLCWAIRLRDGEDALRALLGGYTDGRPFAVCSDAFPAGCLPRPVVPAAVLAPSKPEERKQLRRRTWLPADQAHRSLGDWLAQAIERPPMPARDGSPLPHSVDGARTHNTIDRMTGTTGTGPFAPYRVPARWFAPGARLDLYIAHDPARIDAANLQALLGDIGATGFGRDAGIGRGRFVVIDCAEHRWPRETATHWLTLAPCAPPAGLLDAGRSRYSPVTRFGRHGSVAAASQVPFKRPILMLGTGACLVSGGAQAFTVIGSGLGGERQPLSHAIPATVHQGYAPVVPLDAPEV